jgi:hypothetical protein
VADRAKDFSAGKSVGRATSHEVNTNIHTFTDGGDASGTSHLRNGFANIINYGRYYATKGIRSKQNFVTFVYDDRLSEDNRLGGHFVAVSGYTTDTNGQTNLLIHNPWYGTFEAEPVDQLILGGSISMSDISYRLDLLPNGQTRQGYFSGYHMKYEDKPGHYEPILEIIEAFTGLSAPL